MASLVRDLMNLWPPSVGDLIVHALLRMSELISVKKWIPCSALLNLNSSVDLQF